MGIIKQIFGVLTVAKIKRMAIRLLYGFFRLFPLKRNTVMLFSYYGEQYSGSPKYIGNYLSANTDLKVVWAFVQPKKYANFPGKIVRYGHISYYLTLATAGTIITNYRMTEEFQKRPGQRYIQTWHSSLRLKQIEKDAEKTLPESYIKMAKKDSQQIDILLAGSQKSKEIFERAFWYDGLIAETGTPQCDILLNHDAKIVQRVKRFFRIPEGAHIALYAPTFRKNHDTSVYDLDTEALLDALKVRFGGEWFLLMRLHPHLINMTGCFQYSEKVLQATDYDDVQELLCASDFLISDYSAIMFDYSVTRKPCMLYTPDLEDYTTKDRNLYFNIRELPFACFEKQGEMLIAIRTFDEQDYQNRLELFLHSIGSYDVGKACERVYRLIRGEKQWQS